MSIVLLKKSFPFAMEGIRNAICEGKNAILVKIPILIIPII